MKMKENKGLKKNQMIYIYSLLLTLFIATGLISITLRINSLEEKLRYIDSKRVELENQVENLKKEKNYCEFSKEMLNKIHNEEVD